MKKNNLLISATLILFVAAGTSFGRSPSVHGFAEAAYGYASKDRNTRKDTYNLLEQRLQIKTALYPSKGFLAEWNSEIQLKGDITIDEYKGGAIQGELREASLLLSPLSWVDMKAGRQVFTWGTGDYLFINDLFPKDYISFFTGRDDEYLKKPSDGFKVSAYGSLFNIDMIWIPFFTPNTMPEGIRLSSFYPFTGMIAGQEATRTFNEPARTPSNSEYASRIYKQIGRYEAAFYAFKGYYKAPRGIDDPAQQSFYYPSLNAYGASIRGPVLYGIGSLETGYFLSRDDTDGTNPLIPNSSHKTIAGYSKDLGNDLKAGIQYQVQRMLKYDEYEASLSSREFMQDEINQLFTLRITKLLLKQTLRIVFFGFYSTTDKDGYVRPNINYALTDNFSITAGTNIFWGKYDHTEFGQMKENTNYFTRVRYSF